MTPDARPVPGKVTQLDAAHTLAGDDVAAMLEVKLESGLKADQVLQRTEQYGPNQLPDAPLRSAWLVFASQFKSILILILIGAASLAALIGNTKDALVILAVVVINASVGFYQEYRAEQSLAALKSMLPVKARERRERQKIEIPAKNLVPGDVVLDGGRPGIMQESPRRRSELLLTMARLAKVIAHDVTMRVGTLGILHYTVQTGMTQKAQTLAFTTFLLFQFFNVFNARAERGTAFNRHFFSNAFLWASLGGIVVLQLIAVQWPAAHSVFGTESLSLLNWGMAFGVACSILLLEEGRKLMLALFARVSP